MTLVISRKIPNCHLYNFLKRHCNFFIDLRFLFQFLSICILNPSKLAGENIAAKKNKKNLLQEQFCPIVCMYFWPAQRGQFGSVLFSLSVYWTHLAINKKENKLSWIILVKYLPYYSCHFLSRQYFVKNYPDKKKLQVSIPFSCWCRLFLMRSILHNWFTYTFSNRNNFVVHKMQK